MKILSMAFSLLLLSGLFHSTAIASSENGIYSGVQYANAAYDKNGVPDLEPTLAVFRIGSMFNEGFGFEGRIGIGLSDDATRFNDPDLGNADFKIDIENFLGLYLLGRSGIGDAASVYLLLGFTASVVTASIDTAATTGSVSEDESDLSYGFGLDFNISDSYSLNIEYMSYLDKDDFTVDTISIGIQFERIVNRINGVPFVNQGQIII